MSTYKYNCETCVFQSNSRQKFNMHLSCKRHAETTNNANLFVFSCKYCTKKYKSYSGLQKHTGKCFEIYTQKNNEKLAKELCEIKNAMLEIKDNQIEIKDNQKPSTMIQNNNQNINFILSEHFTKVPNFIDMINNIKLDSNKYPERVSSKEYVETIVNILKQEFDKLPITERPIHCIKDEDENQKIIHIRHQDEWHKENELDWTQQIHNSSIGDDDAPEESEEKIIFAAIKQMEKHIMRKIRNLYGNASARDYHYEVDHPSNKVRIIKYLLEYIHIERDELMQIIEETYRKMQEKRKTVESISTATTIATATTK